MFTATTNAPIDRVIGIDCASATVNIFENEAARVARHMGPPHLFKPERWVNKRTLPVVAAT
jgi:hypothetical protein